MTGGDWQAVVFAVMLAQDLTNSEQASKRIEAKPTLSTLQDVRDATCKCSANLQIGSCTIGSAIARERLWDALTKCCVRIALLSRWCCVIRAARPKCVDRAQDDSAITRRGVRAAENESRSCSQGAFTRDFVVLSQ
eukprot:3647926-Amphidinium_carterae.1